MKRKEMQRLSLYVILRVLVIFSMFASAYKGLWDNVFICVITLVLFTLPSFIGDKFKIKLPTVLESIVYIFIFSAEILGEIQNFYGIFPYWDTVLHTINGFLFAAVGFSLVDILNRNKKTNVKLSPFYVALIAFCFSMTIGIFWEFFEYNVDKYTKNDMQKDYIVNVIKSTKLNEKGKNTPIILKDISKTVIYYDNGKTYTINGYLDIGINDTMKDLFVNFVGAFTFSIIGYIYIKDEQKGTKAGKLAENFIPTIK